MMNYPCEVIDCKLTDLQCLGDCYQVLPWSGHCEHQLAFPVVVTGLPEGFGVIFLFDGWGISGNFLQLEAQGKGMRVDLTDQTSKRGVTTLSKDWLSCSAVSCPDYNWWTLLHWTTPQQLGVSEEPLAEEVSSSCLLCLHSYNNIL